MNNSSITEDAASIVSSAPFLYLGAPVAIFVLTSWLSLGNSRLNKNFPLSFRILGTIRAPLIMFVVIPLSFLFNCYRRIRGFFRQSHVVGSEGHKERCQVVIDQIKEWNEKGRPKKLRTARPSWAAMSTKLSSNKEDCAKISTNNLNHILSINEKTLIITCEPNVNMGQITRALIPMNLALKCQIEMESLTIGGISSGWGVETNSYEHGFFQESIRAYKICTSDGNVLTVTKESNPDLFYALPWSHGSLGFLLSVTVELIRVKPFVKITYIPTFSGQDLQRKLEDYTIHHPSHTFVEATVYSKEQAVIQLGEFVDEAPPGRYNAINHFWKPFYYKHVETFLTTGADWEVVPIYHFYHRFTRSIFWELEDMIPFSNHPIYRCLWGWLGAPEVSLLKLLQGPIVRRCSVYAHVVQESIMPLRHLQEGVEKFDDWFGVYPLLVFPIRVYSRGKHSGFLTPRNKKDVLPGKNFGMWVDLGAYGVPRAIKQGKEWDPKANIRAMEHWTRETGGFQATYTDLWCTQKEFRQMFNHDLYDEQRVKYNCLDAFPEVFDKIKPEEGVVDLTDILEKEEAEA